jgi:hypothetical protein
VTVAGIPAGASSAGALARWKMETLAVKSRGPPGAGWPEICRQRRLPAVPPVEFPECGECLGIQLRRQMRRERDQRYVPVLTGSRPAIASARASSVVTLLRNHGAKLVGARARSSGCWRWPRASALASTDSRSRPERRGTPPERQPGTGHRMAAAEVRRTASGTESDRWAGWCRRSGSVRTGRSCTATCGDGRFSTSSSVTGMLPAVRGRPRRSSSWSVRASADHPSRVRPERRPVPPSAGQADDPTVGSMPRSASGLPTPPVYQRRRHW